MGAVAFTNNYSDLSTREGYQFEFRCERCGNGYQSTFRHSVTGFGGRIASFGGSLLGGEVGGKVEQAGWAAEWMRDGNRGSTRDKRLAEAAEECIQYFSQCHRCGQWVCKQVCWNDERGLCTTCAPKLDQEIAGIQSAVQVEQLNQAIRQQNLIQDVNYTDQGTGLCSSCHQEGGGGKFCQHCGTPLAAAPATTKKFCGNCGSELKGAKFCGECGTPAA